MSAHKDRYLKELASANKTIQDAGALRTDEDGYQWIDRDSMNHGFVNYYQGLLSAGYALGFI